AERDDRRRSSRLPDTSAQKRSIMQNLAMQRENVRIVLDGRGPSVEVHPYHEAVPDDGVLVRTLFSLLGTQPEETLLSCLPNALYLPSQPGYASVGVVEAVGTDCARFNPNDVVILPACYSTYVTLDGVQVQRLSKTLLHHIPPDHDPVSATFVPLISLAMYLARQAIGMEGEWTVLFGCGLLGIVLVRILQRENPSLRLLVYVEDDLYDGLLQEHGIQEVRRYGKPL